MIQIASLQLDCAQWHVAGQHGGTLSGRGAVAWRLKMMVDVKSLNHMGRI